MQQIPMNNDKYITIFADQGIGVDEYVKLVHCVFL